MDTVVDFNRAITNLDSLPMMPAIAQKLLALNLSTDEGEQTLLNLIGLDPPILAKVIGLANSPMFGSSAKVSTIKEAAIRLGLARIKSLAIGIAIMSARSHQAEGKFKSKVLWLNSLGVTFAMEAIAKVMPAHTRPSDDMIFLSGLLHDIGYLAIAHLDMNSADILYAQIQVQTNRSIIDIERSMLGMTHSEIGAVLGRHWGLSKEVISVILNHHTPDQSRSIVEQEWSDQGSSAIGQPLISMVNIAEKIIPEFCIAQHADVESIGEQEWLDLGIDPGRADEIRSYVEDASAQAYKVASGAF
jgi:HD-like signal output (HDOD) protein